MSILAQKHASALSMLIHQRRGNRRLNFGRIDLKSRAAERKQRRASRSAIEFNFGGNILLRMFDCAY
jgi:hypothetical protein